MGRQEKPLDPEQGPVARLAHDLRRLRREAGGPTYAAMARRAGYSVATLSRAAAGEQLPSLPVVRAYATACGADPEEWEERWHAVSGELAARERTDDVPSPYRGLARFEPGDEEVFFGREALSDDLLALTRGHGVVALLGPSGSGKSSLLRAGLIPRLRRELRSGERDMGSRPAAVRVLTPGARPLDRHRSSFVPAAGEGQTWVIVDQFEELFTLCPDPTERLAFTEMLLTARSAESRLRVVLGIRADFYARCLEHPDLAVVMRESTLPVGPMTDTELRQVITKPAGVRGTVVERALTARLLEAVVAERTALPLLSHVLLETWRRRQGRTLTLAAYEQAGGLGGSITQAAEAAYTSLDEDRQATARRMLLRLVTPGDGAPDTKRPSTRGELAGLGPGAADVLDHLGRGRLVTLDHERVDLTHEALITGWPRLAGWIEEDRDRLRLHRRLTEAAEGWKSLGWDRGALLRGTGLKSAAQAFASADDANALTPGERDFLTRSMDARRLRIRLRRTTTGVLSVLVLLSVLGAVIAVQQSRARNEQQTQNAARRTTTVAGSLRTTDPGLAGRLSIAAWRLAQTPESRSALLAALGQRSEPDFTPSVRNTETSHASLSSDGRFMRIQEGERVQVWNTTTHIRTGSYTVPGLTTVSSMGDPRDDELWPSYPGLPVWSPDGRWAADAARGGGLTLWDVPAGERRTLLARWTNPVMDISLSEQGRRVAVAMEGHAEVWDSTGKRPLVTLRGARIGDGAVTLSRDGSLVARCGAGVRVEIWRIPSGRRVPLKALEVPREAIRPTCRPGSLRFSPDGRTLLALREQGVERIDTVTGDTLDELAQRGLTEVFFSPDSRFVVGVTNDRLLVWRNTRNPPDWQDPYNEWDGSMLLNLPLSPQDKPYSVRIDTAAGVIRYIGMGGRTVRTINTRDILTAVWDDKKRPPSLPSPTGHVTAVPRTTGHELSYELRDTGTGRLIGTTPAVRYLPGRAPKPVAAFSPDGRFFAFTPISTPPDHRNAPGMPSQHILVWDMDLRRPAGDITMRRGQQPPDPLAVVNSGGRPVVYGIVSIQVWDLTNSKPLTPPREGMSATQMALHPRTSLMALNDGTVLKLPTGRLLRDRTERDLGDAMTYSTSGDLLAVADGSGRILLYDGATTSPRGVLAGGEPDGPDGTPVPVTALAFSPDGRTLAAGTRAGGIRLWDIPSRTVIGAPLPTSGDRVRTLAFSADGQSLHIQGASTRPRTQLLAPERLAAELCARFGSLTRSQWTTYIPDEEYRDIC
ncbi:helix-turn-helix domain-containing protein [Streptomyces sp. NPDC050842]|uniref:nSTAND1 domain-containing NTPase n=2 Tax=unclassified Streptomyces TaxID=2593676 RepID=UPI0037A8FFA6